MTTSEEENGAVGDAMALFADDLAGAVEGIAQDPCLPAVAAEPVQHRAAEREGTAQTPTREAQVRAAQVDAEDDEEPAATAMFEARAPDSDAPSSPPGGSSFSYDRGLWPQFRDRGYMRPSDRTLVFGLLKSEPLPAELVAVPATARACMHFVIAQPFEPVQQPVICAALGSGGLRPLPRVPRGARWILRWSAARNKPEKGRYSVYGQLGAEQRYNHFPGSYELGHKDLLHRSIERQIQVIPTPLHVLGRISPIFSPFFPIFCAFSPSRRDGSNEPQAGIQGQETAARAPKHRFAGPS